jgi:hypothetical protein
MILYIEIKLNTDKNFSQKMSLKNIRFVYQKIKPLLYKEQLVKLSYNDSRDDIFNRFFIEINSINCERFFNINQNFIFNLNPAIKVSIIKELHHFFDYIYK